MFGGPERPFGSTCRTIADLTTLSISEGFSPGVVADTTFEVELPLLPSTVPIL